MGNFRYIEVDKLVRDEAGRLHKRWGIAALADEKEIIRYEDMSDDCSAVSALAERLNGMDADIVHLGDIVNDFVAEWA